MCIDSNDLRQELNLKFLVQLTVNKHLRDKICFNKDIFETNHPEPTKIVNGKKKICSFCLMFKRIPHLFEEQKYTF